MRCTYLIDRAIGVLAAFLALALCFIVTSANASANEIDPAQATWVSPKILNGEETRNLTSNGYRVFYSQQNASTFSASNLQTQCISSHMHATLVRIISAAM